MFYCLWRSLMGGGCRVRAGNLFRCDDAFAPIGSLPEYLCQNAIIKLERRVIANVDDKKMTGRINNY